MHYEHIQQALDRVQATLSKEELEELLQENQSYICTEFRPEFSNWFEDTLDTLDDASIDAIMTTVDNFWIFILNQHVKTIEQTMSDLKNASEMYVLAKAVNQEDIKTALTKIQNEIYNEASNGKFYLITKSLLTLNDQQLKIVVDKLKSLKYEFEFLIDKPDLTLTSSKAHKIIWGLKSDLE